MALLRVRVNLANMTVGPGLSTFFFNGTGQTAADAAADAAHDFYEAIKGHMPNYGTATVDAEVDELNPVGGGLLASYAVTPQQTTGTATNDQLPAATQGLLRLATGVIVAGRQLKGHLFIPGATEADCAAGGVPAAAYATVVNNAGAALAADTLSDWVVWSRTHDVAHTVTGAFLANQFAVLRSRRD